MTPEDAVRHAFPEIDRIDDDELRDGVIDAWSTAMIDNGVDDLASVAWHPVLQAELDIEDEFLVDHVLDVTRGVLALASVLDQRPEVEIDYDVLVTGALVHDVSRLYELDGTKSTPIGDYLGHPHYGAHVAAEAGLGAEIQHIVLSHSGGTTVEPATLEAELVRSVDDVAGSAIMSLGVDDLRDV